MHEDDNNSASSRSSESTSDDDDDDASFFIGDDGEGFCRSMSILDSDISESCHSLDETDSDATDENNGGGQSLLTLDADDEQDNSIIQKGTNSIISPGVQSDRDDSVEESSQSDMGTNTSSIEHSLNSMELNEEDTNDPDEHSMGTHDADTSTASEADEHGQVNVDSDSISLATADPEDKHENSIQRRNSTFLPDTQSDQFDSDVSSEKDGVANTSLSEQDLDSMGDRDDNKHPVKEDSMSIHDSDIDDCYPSSSAAIDSEAEQDNVIMERRDQYDSDVASYSSLPRQALSNLGQVEQDAEEEGLCHSTSNHDSDVNETTSNADEDDKVYHADELSLVDGTMDDNSVLQRKNSIPPDQISESYDRNTRDTASKTDECDEFNDGDNQSLMDRTIDPEDEQESFNSQSENSVSEEDETSSHSTSIPGSKNSEADSIATIDVEDKCEHSVIKGRSSMSRDQDDADDSSSENDVETNISENIVSSDLKLNQRNETSSDELDSPISLEQFHGRFHDWASNVVFSRLLVEKLDGKCFQDGIREITNTGISHESHQCSDDNDINDDTTKHARKSVKFENCEIIIDTNNEEECDPILRSRAHVVVSSPQNEDKIDDSGGHSEKDEILDESLSNQIAPGTPIDLTAVEHDEIPFHDWVSSVVFAKLPSERLETNNTTLQELVKTSSSASNPDQPCSTDDAAAEVMNAKVLNSEDSAKGKTNTHIANFVVSEDWSMDKRATSNKRDDFPAAPQCMECDSTQQLPLDAELSPNNASGRAIKSDIAHGGKLAAKTLIHQSISYKDWAVSVVFSGLQTKRQYDESISTKSTFDEWAVSVVFNAMPEGIAPNVEVQSMQQMKESIIEEESNNMTNGKSVVLPSEIKHASLQQEPSSVKVKEDEKDAFIDQSNRRIHSQKPEYGVEVKDSYTPSTKTPQPATKIEPFEDWATGIVFNGMKDKSERRDLNETENGEIHALVGSAQSEKPTIVSSGGKKLTTSDAGVQNEKSKDWNTIQPLVSSKESKAISFRDHDSLIQESSFISRPSNRALLEEKKTNDLQSILSEAPNNFSVDMKGKSVEDINTKHDESNSSPRPPQSDTTESKQRLDKLQSQEETSMKLPACPSGLVDHDIQTNTKETVHSNDRSSGNVVERATLALVEEQGLQLKEKESHRADHQELNNDQRHSAQTNRDRVQRPKQIPQTSYIANASETGKDNEAQYCIPQIITVAAMKENAEAKVGLVFMDINRRIILTKITSNSPFRDTGIKNNDEMLVINGHRIKNARKGAETIKALPPGRLTVTVFQGKRPRESELEMVRLSLSECEDIQFCTDNGLVNVVKVTGRFAKKIYAGDICLSINGHPVRSADSAKKLLQEAAVQNQPDYHRFASEYDISTTPTKQSSLPGGLVIMLIFSKGKLRYRLTKKLSNNIPLVWNKYYNECSIKSTETIHNNTQPILRIHNDGNCEDLIESPENIEASTMRDIQMFATKFYTQYQYCMSELRDAIRNAKSSPGCIFEPK